MADTGSPSAPPSQSTPFPSIDDAEAGAEQDEGQIQETPANNGRTRGKSTTLASVASTATAATNRIRSTSIKLLNADAPLGMWAASSQAAAKAPTIGDIRERQFVEDGWQHEVQRHYKEQRRSTMSSGSDSPTTGSGPAGRRWSIVRRSSTGLLPAGTESEGSAKVPTVDTKRKPTLDGTNFPALEEEDTLEAAPSKGLVEVLPAQDVVQHADGTVDVLSEKGKLPITTSQPLPAEPPLPAYLHPLPSGYIPPPKLPWTTSAAIGLAAFWKWFLTPAGFLITLYALNVVAWGGMLFLLLCNAAPAMCHPTCNDINSPRRIWIEIDSQILNALFCVTGFGLVPWRFRDLWWLLVYRLGLRGRDEHARSLGLRRLAGIHRSWFRLPGSDRLGVVVVLPDDPHAVLDDVRTPVPASKTPQDPLTGVRAPPTRIWKLDFVIWCNVANTLLQAVLCVFMWGMNRHNRPSWATGLFIALACIVAGLGGCMMYTEGKKVKRVEGVLPNMSRLRHLEMADPEHAVTPHGFKGEKTSKL